MPTHRPRRFAVLCFTLALCAAPSLVADTPSEPTVRHDLLVSTDELASRLAEPGTVVLHVGGADSYTEGHIPGARWLPWATIAVERDGVPGEFPDPATLAETFRLLGVGDGDRVVLYDTARGIPAARGFVALDLLGLGDRAAVLDGQFAKWRAEDRPIETGAPRRPAPAASLTVDPRPERIISHEALRNRLDTDLETGLEADLVDARSAAEFSGTSPGRAIDPERGGHLPGARHLFWEDHLADGELPVLAPADELRRHFAAIGVEPGDPVVTYCRTGGKASHTYFVLRYLGHDDVSMYDGSFIQWHADPDAPVVTGDAAE